MEGLGALILILLFINIGIPVLAVQFVIRRIFNVRWLQNKELVEDISQVVREALAEYKEKTNNDSSNSEEPHQNNKTD